MPLRLTLELDSGKDPITGVIRDTTGSSHPFVGWLGLALALQECLDEAAAA